MAGVVGGGGSKVHIIPTEEAYDGTTWRPRVMLMDTNGNGALLDLDATERNRLREVLDEIGPDDWSKR